MRSAFWGEYGNGRRSRQDRQAPGRAESPRGPQRRKTYTSNGAGAGRPATPRTDRSGPEGHAGHRAIPCRVSDRLPQAARGGDVAGDNRNGVRRPSTRDRCAGGRRSRKCRMKTPCKTAAISVQGGYHDYIENRCSALFRSTPAMAGPGHSPRNSHKTGVAAKMSDGKRAFLHILDGVPDPGSKRCPIRGGPGRYRGHDQCGFHRIPFPERTQRNQQVYSTPATADRTTSAAEISEVV